MEEPIENAMPTNEAVQPTDEKVDTTNQQNVAMAADETNEMAENASLASVETAAEEAVAEAQSAAETVAEQAEAQAEAEETAEAEQTEAPAEAVAEQAEAPAEAVAEQTEAPAAAAAVAEQTEAPAEAEETAEAEQAEAPAEAEETAKAEQAEAPAEAEETTEAGQAEAAEDAEDEESVEPVEDYSSYTREELVAAFKELIQQDIETIKSRALDMRARFGELSRVAHQKAYEAFIAEGGNKEEYQAPADPTGDEFRELFDSYRKLRQEHVAAIEAQKKANYEAKQGILEELRQLVASDDDSLKAAYEQFNSIQEHWKSIGQVASDKAGDLWQNYHFLVEQFFNKVNIAKELRMNYLKKNLEQKVALCEKAEEMIVETSIQKAINTLRQLRESWREIGPVPSENNEEIWHRFCNAADQIEQRRREFVEQRQEEFEKNLLAKQALIKETEDITAIMPTSTKQWGEIGDKLDEMLKIWKSIGPVARDVNEDVWRQFKGRIDQFYASKKEYFGKMRDEQNENYNRKIDLCLKAEAIAKRNDWKRATEELLQLQAEWKTIGPVSRKLSEKVWQRFRGACDEFFRNKGDHFKNQRGMEQENLQKKEELIAKLREFQFGDNKEANLSAIKDFQRQWMEIGYVPIADKDRLQQEFRSIINGHFDRLKISLREAEENAYRDRVRSNGGDRRAASSEKQTLLDKIAAMRGDITLWENNMGFLSNSRSAEILKQEFEKKIQSARQQLALLEAKVRIMSEEEAKKAEAQGGEKNDAEAE